MNDNTPPGGGLFCPLTTGLVTRMRKGLLRGGAPVTEQLILPVECGREKCLWWMTEEEGCAVPIIAHLLLLPSRDAGEEENGE